MNILVLIKQVPDTETHIHINGDKIEESSIKWIISPYDEIALEEGIRCREKKGGAVTVISVGPDRVISALRTAYAMGADNAIHIKTDDYAMFDSYTIAEAIDKATEGMTFEMIFAGRQGIDSDNGLVPLILATRKNMGAIIWAKSVAIDDAKVTVTCESDGGEAVFECPYPVLITTQMGLNEPRYPSLKGIMASKKKPIDTKTLADLGLSFGTHIEVLGYELPPARPSGKIIEGADAAAKAGALVKALHEEIKAI